MTQLLVEHLSGQPSPRRQHVPAKPPIMVAVGGDSGTGKTTLCRGLFNIFGADRIETICLDDYHSLDRAQRKAVGITALDPRANNFALMEEQLWQLSRGNAIDKPIYDHTDGTLRGPERIEPKDIVVVQGLFPLFTRALRELFAVSVWLDPETDLKIAWKIQRDTTQRGYDEREVRDEIEKRQPDIAAYVAPQAVHADLHVRFLRPSAAPFDNTRLTASIRKSGRFKPLDYSEFEAKSTKFRQLQRENGAAYPDTIIELDGDVDEATSLALQDKIWSHMPSHAHLRPDNLGQFDDHEGRHVSHSLALAQLLIARRLALVEDELLDRLERLA